MRKITVLFIIMAFIPLLATESLALNITSLALYDDENGGTTIPATSMTPNNEMTLAFGITSSSSLKEVSVTLYDSSKTAESSCYNTDSPESSDRCSWVEWKNNSGEELFADIRPTQTSWAIDKPNSLISRSSTSKLVFTPSKSSSYTDAASWTIYVRAKNATSAVTKSITVNNTYYLELSAGKSSAEFEPGMKNTLNHELVDLESNGYDLSYIPLTIISNAPYSWKVKSTDFSGGSTIDVDNDTLGVALSNTPSSQTYINTSYRNIETAHAATIDSGDQKQLFMWLDYPDDPDTTYTATLTLQAYITADSSKSSSEPTVSLSASTDNTAPTIDVISPAPLAWTKKGRTLSYSINVTDTRSGFMNSLGKNSCKIYFGGTQVSQSYVQKSPDYKTGTCTGSFTVPSTTNKNVNLNATIEDKSGNPAYDDTVWLQIDQSSLDITDIELISTAKPNDLEWYFLPEDTFRVVGHVKNQAGDAVNSTIKSYLSIPGATVTVNSTTVSSSSPYTVSSSGNIDIEYSFTGSSIGPATLYITAEDQMNNTETYSKTFYITDYIDSLRFVTSFMDKIYTQGDNISIEVKTSSSTNPVYMANITALMRDDHNNVIQTSKVQTKNTGKATFYFDIPKKPSDYYTVSLTGVSPLDTTESVSNTSTMDTEWLDIDVDVHSDAYIDTNLTTRVTVTGRADYSKDPGNDTLVEGAKVTCFMRGPGKYNDTDTATLNSTSEYYCDGLKNITAAGRYRFEISAEKKIDGVTIRGWNKLEYIDVINLSAGPYDSIGSSDKQSILGISGNREHLYMPQGENSTYTFTVENTGTLQQKNITIKISAKEAQSHGITFTRPSIIGELNASEKATIPIAITSGSSTERGAYNVTVTLASLSGASTDTRFTLHVTIGSEGQLKINKTCINLRAKIQKLRREMNTLLPSSSKNIIALNNTIARMEKYLTDLESQIELGDYDSAENTIAAINDMIDANEIALRKELDDMDSTRARNIIIAIIILVVIILASLLYYMWLPEKPTDFEFDKKEKISPKDIIMGAAQKIESYIEKLRHTQNAEDPKYNYHRKDRWSKS